MSSTLLILLNRMRNLYLHKMLLDHIIYGNHHEDLISKFLSIAEELSIKWTIEMICTHEAMDACVKKSRDRWTA